MKATVVEIQSKMYYTTTKPNPYRMIALQFNLPLVHGGPCILRLPETELGLVGVELDDILEVEFNLPEQGSEEREDS